MEQLLTERDAYIAKLEAELASLRAQVQEKDRDGDGVIRGERGVDGRGGCGRWGGDGESARDIQI